MSRNIGFLGWALALVFMSASVYLYSDRPPADLTANGREPVQEAPAQEESPPPAKLNAVYVRPHPPDFTQGRYVHFISYRKISEDGLEKVIFWNGSTYLKVSSEAVDWPQQRAVSPLK